MYVVTYGFLGPIQKEHDERKMCMIDIAGVLTAVHWDVARFEATKAVLSGKGYNSFVTRLAGWTEWLPQRKPAYHGLPGITRSDLHGMLSDVTWLAREELK